MERLILLSVFATNVNGVFILLKMSQTIKNSITWLIILVKVGEIQISTSNLLQAFPHDSTLQSKANQIWELNHNMQLFFLDIALDETSKTELELPPNVVPQIKLISKKFFEILNVIHTGTALAYTYTLQT